MDLLCLQVAQMPIYPDLAIFFVVTTTTDDRQNRLLYPLRMRGVIIIQHYLQYYVARETLYSMSMIRYCFFAMILTVMMLKNISMSIIKTLIANDIRIIEHEYRTTKNQPYLHYIVWVSWHNWCWLHIIILLLWYSCLWYWDLWGLLPWYTVWYRYHWDFCYDTHATWYRITAMILML